MACFLYFSMKMNRARLRDPNLLDIYKIILLALLQATLITGQLNHLILQESFYLYSILLAFILFQLVMIYPLGFPPLPIDDWTGFIRKIRPLILEIVLGAISLAKKDISFFAASCFLKTLPLCLNQPLTWHLLLSSCKDVQPYCGSIKILCSFKIDFHPL